MMQCKATPKVDTFDKRSDLRYTIISMITVSLRDHNLILLDIWFLKYISDWMHKMQKMVPSMLFGNVRCRVGWGKYCNIIKMAMGPLLISTRYYVPENFQHWQWKIIFKYIPPLKLNITFMQTISLIYRCNQGHHWKGSHGWSSITWWKKQSFSSHTVLYFFILTFFFLILFYAHLHGDTNCWRWKL